MQTPLWLVSPFFMLLLSIAILPVMQPQLWHRWYKFLSVGLGLLVGMYYLLFIGNIALPIEACSEYFSFISLMVLLYVASGGIFLFIDRPANVVNNCIFLLLAAIASNLIGTTGASILLVRPFIRLNRYRVKAYHIVFFIFIVSNMGGMLTPIADPPLFIGFLKGVPFTWTLFQLWLPWITGLGMCLLAFCFFDSRNKELNAIDSDKKHSGKIVIQGKRNVIWLGIAVGSVFLDPALFNWIPAIQYHGQSISYLRECLQLVVAFICYRTANQKALLSNDFNFTPIVEVVFLFFGIFLSMIPLVEWLTLAVQNGPLASNVNTPVLFGLTGFFSSFLDNAPTYLSMFTMMLAANGFSVHSTADVQAFLNGNASHLLAAISVSSVVFGAMTYIGNGPNLMVKYIAEQTGIEMPSFGSYILRFSLPILLPIFAVIYLLYFR